MGRDMICWGLMTKLCQHNHGQILALFTHLTSISILSTGRWGKVMAFLWHSSSGLFYKIIIILLAYWSYQPWNLFIADSASSWLKKVLYKGLFKNMIIISYSDFFRTYFLYLDFKDRVLPFLCLFPCLFAILISS